MLAVIAQLQGFHYFMRCSNLLTTCFKAQLEVKAHVTGAELNLVHDLRGQPCTNCNTLVYNTSFNAAGTNGKGCSATK